MLSKPRLIKKVRTEDAHTQQNKQVPTSEKQERALLTYKTIQTTKNWLAGHQQKQLNARQKFAALFITSDTQSTAV